jgi:hypothetical protein
VGKNSFSFTVTQAFNVPAVGTEVSAWVADASWIMLGQMLMIANAAGTGKTGALQVTAINGNELTLLNPPTSIGIAAPGTTVPIASAIGPGGAQGGQGVQGTIWFNGSGPPGTIGAARAGDYYLDNLSGNYYQF